MIWLKELISDNKTWGIKYKDFKWFLEYTKVKDDLIEYKCLCCNRNYQQLRDENLKKKFANAGKCSSPDISSFILMLDKGVYPYEYKDDWEKINDTSLLEKEEFYSHLNMKGITDADYTQAKMVGENFEIKNLCEYHDLYVQSNN